MKSLLLAIFWSPLRWVFYVLPGPITSMGAEIAGRALCAALKTRRAIMKEELRALLPGRSEVEYSDIVRRALVFHVEDEVDKLFFHVPSYVNRVVRIEGREILDEALAEGKGCILALFHYGNNMLMIPALGFAGYKVNQAAEGESSTHEVRRPGLLERYVLRQRRRSGDRMPATMLHVDESVRALYRVLKQGEPLLIAIDGRRGAGIKPYKVLSRQMNLSSGIFKMAQSTGAPVLPVFIFRTGGMHHVLKVEPRVRFASVDEGVTSLLRVFEGYVLREPGHYTLNMLFERLRDAMGGENPLFGDYPKGRPDA